VVEELTDADPVSVRDDSGQPLLDGVFQTELALTDQLQDDRRRVGLGHARDLEVVVRSHRCLSSDVSQSRRQAGDAISVPDEQDRAGCAGSDERVEVTLQAGCPAA
jgi:hypothetical protein